MFFESTCLIASSLESIKGGYAVSIAKNKGYQTDTLSSYPMHPQENIGVVLVSLCYLEITTILGEQKSHHYINL